MLLSGIAEIAASIGISAEDVTHDPHSITDLELRESAKKVEVISIAMKVIKAKRILQEASTTVFKLIGPVIEGESSIDDARFMDCNDGLTKSMHLLLICDYINGNKETRGAFVKLREAINDSKTPLSAKNS
jgi:hypothetical protein